MTIVEELGKLDDTIRHLKEELPWASAERKRIMRSVIRTLKAERQIKRRAAYEESVAEYDHKK